MFSSKQSSMKALLKQVFKSYYLKVSIVPNLCFIWSNTRLFCNI